ncbi:MAG: hypothetical protein COB46_13120 [Rhodospirillaceae bacterium]|nr:MAG: hypothetical protein COB46_13120 [Rhodospirillaceae bacterium]
MDDNNTGACTQPDIEDVIELLHRLTPLQVGVVHAIIQRFADEQISQQLRDDFLTQQAFEYFAMRLAAHHASSSTYLKKENFEHILEQAFKQSGVYAKKADSMTVRGADLSVGDITVSLKTEAAKGLKPNAITISKLMEAALSMTA